MTEPRDVGDPGRWRLHIENVVKSFDGRVVVDVADTWLGEHPVEGLIGPNGAGKTTLMRLVMHSISLDAGAVTLSAPDRTAGSSRDQVLSRLRPHQIAQLGVVKSNQVIQDFAPLTVYDSMMLALARPADEWPHRVRLDDGAWRRHTEEASAYLHRFGLQRLSAFAKSAGEKKLLDIIRCLLLRPKVLLLDEPTAGLPKEMRDRVMAFIKELASEQYVSVVLVEHDLDLIWTMTDYVHFMAEGSVLLQGTPDFIRGHQTVVEKYLGSRHARG